MLQTADHSGGAKSGATETSALVLPMMRMELELAVDVWCGGAEHFVRDMRDLCEETGATFLFDLPAEGLIADCQRLVVLRLAEDETLLVLLNADGDSLRLEEPDAQSQSLVALADAFVGVFIQMDAATLQPHSALQ